MSYHGPIISTYHHESAMSEQWTIGNSWASATWGTANAAIFIPFKVYHPFTYQKIFVVNGSAVSGNIDLGIYDSEKHRLGSTGSTAQSGTNAIQSMSLSGTLLPGWYYFGVACDNTTATMIRFSSGGPRNKFSHTFTQTSAFALPSTASHSNYSLTNIPIVGITSRSFL